MVCNYTRSKKNYFNPGNYKYIYIYIKEFSPNKHIYLIINQMLIHLYDLFFKWPHTFPLTNITVY